MSDLKNINGVEVTTSDISCPDNREFRDSWCLDGSVIEFDMEKVKEIHAEKMREEAYRRIIEICPEWEQRNLIAKASILSAKGQENWTDEDKTAWDEGNIIWERVNNIRSKSNELEESITEDTLFDDWYSDEKW